MNNIRRLSELQSVAAFVVRVSNFVVDNDSDIHDSYQEPLNCPLNSNISCKIISLSKSAAGLDDTLTRARSCDAASAQR